MTGPTQVPNRTSTGLARTPTVAPCRPLPWAARHESTGIYWKSVFAHLKNQGIQAWVVNAHFIKHVPGRKTDMLDAEWLAVLARFGLVRGSFIPPHDLRELRLVSRYRRKLAAMCASQINRLHKMLDDAGIKLGAVVSDIHGVSARAMVRGLIEGQSQAVLLSHARGALKRKTEEFAAVILGSGPAVPQFMLRVGRHSHRLTGVGLHGNEQRLSAARPSR